MEEQLFSGDISKLEASIEAAFLAGFIRAEGVNSVSSVESKQEADDMAFQIEENPTARITYPWNPSSLEAEVFFMAADDCSIFDGWQDDEIVTRSRSFFNTIDRLWAAPTLQTSLVERFAARIPHHWLMQIADQAQRIFTETTQAVSEQSTLLADQLVQCVREIAPNLAEEDFYVLARPLAAQMRDGGVINTIDSTIAQVPQVEWERLSDVQRARLSLAIARYAISELQASQDI